MTSDAEQLCGTTVARRFFDPPAADGKRAFPPAALSWEVKPRLVGDSPALQRLVHLLDRVAPTELPLLIWGPTGAGKEVVAQLVHQRHNGGREPFVDLNCGAIPEQLMESELFGAAKGAYTGAQSHRPGQLELAGQGTLFLDEVGEMPLALQPKLLRVLETRTFRPLGSREVKRFEGRVVAATHRDLLASVHEGRFREDLYYRLAPFVLEVPGLEQRRDDIPALAQHFAARQPRALSFTPEALERLRRHPWPGNVRQLRNLVDRLGVLAESTLITAEVLESFLSPVATGAQDTRQLADALLQLPGADKLCAAEQLLVDRALELSQGNKTLAARMLGVNRKVVERRVLVREDRRVTVQRQIEQGRSLVQRTEFSAAIAVLERGLALLRALPVQDEAVRRLQFEALRLLAVSRRSVEGWLSEQANACYEQALAVGSKLVGEAELISILFGMWTGQLMALDLCAARATAQQMLQRAQVGGHAAELGDAHLALANTLFWLGDSAEALACLSRGGLVPVPDAPRHSVHGFDLTVLALSFEGLAAFQVGQFGTARRAWQELSRRGDEAHVFDRVIALQGAAWLACLFDDRAALQPAAQALESLSRAHGLPFYQGLGQLLHAFAQAGAAELQATERTMAEGYETLMLRNGGKLFHSFQAWKRAELLLAAGDAARADAVAMQALDIALEHQDRAYLAELMVVRARARWALGEAADADQGWRSALSTAMALGSVPGRVAAGMHLAELLCRSGRAAAAQEQLARALRGVVEEAAPPLVVAAFSLLRLLQSGERSCTHLEGDRRHGV